MARSGKSKPSYWLLFFFLVLGVFVGGLIGEYLAQYVPFLNWSSPSYGLNPPLTLNLGMLAMTFGVNLRLSVAGALGLLAGYFAYRAI